LESAAEDGALHTLSRLRMVFSIPEAIASFTVAGWFLSFRQFPLLCS
jgi:hypothetical protein